MQPLLPLRTHYNAFQVSTVDYGKWLTRLQDVGQRLNTALLGGAIGVVAAFLISGAVAAIALISVGIAVGVYLHQIDRLYLSWLPWQRWWRPANRPLTLSLLSLVGAFLVGFALLQVWQRSSWPGLMTLVMAQTLMIAIALLKFFAARRPATQATSPKTSSPETDTAECDAILTALATDHPVHQLVAIRQALRWASTTSDAAAVEAIADCFTMLLRRQPDPTVARSLQRGLAQIKPLTNLATIAHPVPISAK